MRQPSAPRLKIFVVKIVTATFCPSSELLRFSYNVTQADYANLVSEKNARERALRDVAEQIRLRLGNYFDRKPEIERRQQEKLLLEQQRLNQPVPAPPQPAGIRPEQQRGLLQ